MSDPTDFLPTARRLALEAGACIMELLKETLIHHRKADKSLVTNADFASDKIIKEGLLSAFPDHAVLTEESGFSGKSDSPYVWVIDPLDGTKAYAKNQPGFSVMIGLLHEAKPVLGVVFDPKEGHLYEAVKGQGAFYEFQGGKRERVRVSSRTVWGEMPFLTSPGFPQGMLEYFQHTLQVPLVPPINSVGVKVGLMVRQVADLYYSHHPIHYWDSVAPQVILEESGGVFTLINGQPLSYDLSSHYRHSLSPFASNGTRHQEFLEMLARYREIS